MDDQKISPPPHIIVFPSPLQCPLNPIFDLAELLCLSGLDVTFLLIPYTHNLLLRHINIESRLNPYTNFRLHTISDGLPSDHPQSNTTDMLQSLETLTKPLFRDLLTSGRLICDELGPVSYIISDGFMNFVYDVADEIKVPVISALTISRSCLWFLSNHPNSTGAAEVSDPTIGEHNADSFIKRVPGIEGILSGGDLTNMCPPNHIMNQIEQLPRSHGLILNTFKALDAPILSKIRSICPNLYAIGPIYKHLGFRQEAKRMTPLLNYSVEQTNNDCITWLNSQQPKSVLYVNIENHTQLSRVQRLELWNGLVNSEKGFLWVRQPESIPSRIPAKLIKGTKEKGFIDDSASNYRVLTHKAIGGWLTVGDWDSSHSTLQGIVEGAPMIYWPTYWDQRVNSKFIIKKWDLGVYLEEGWNRNIIEKTIRDVMGLKGEVIDNVNKMKKLARKSVSVDGSSHAMLDHLDI
ncbi:hypothetical protein LXL04_012334 [Taraxacum kok-saghyz]